MKQTFTRAILFCAIAIASLHFTACKKDQPAAVNENPVTETDTAAVAAEPYTVPVTVSPDEDLETQVQDAVKDFPGVISTVKEGEVILTGQIERGRLPKLMQSLHATHPKKITNNLTVKE